MEGSESAAGLPDPDQVGPIPEPAAPDYFALRGATRSLQTARDSGGREGSGEGRRGLRSARVGEWQGQFLLVVVIGWGESGKSASPPRFATSCRLECRPGRPGNTRGSVLRRPGRGG